MKNKMMMLTAAALVAAGGVSTEASAKAKRAMCQMPTVAQVEAQFATFNAAWATKDPAKVTALFTDNAVLLATVSNTPRTTPAAINDYFVSFLKNNPQGTITSSTTKVDCNTASRLGTWTVTFTDSATGVKTDVLARYSFIYRYVGGQWKIDHLHSSMLPEVAKS